MILTKKGMFITFEGCEGCGKSTQSELLKQYLQDKGFNVILTREPGGNIVAEKIRSILLNPNFKIASMCELFLYEAARIQHLYDIIKPNLEKGNIVICDRFTDSTVAYQGFGRKIDVKIIEKINDIATEGIKPNLTIYLDIIPKTGIERAKIKQDFTNGDRIEREALKFHNNVRKGFLNLVKKYPKRIKKIKTQETIQQTHKLIIKEIEKCLKI